MYKIRLSSLCCSMECYLSTGKVPHFSSRGILCRLIYPTTLAPWLESRRRFEISGFVGKLEALRCQMVKVIWIYVERLLNEPCRTISATKYKYNTNKCSCLTCLTSIKQRVNAGNTISPSSSFFPILIATFFMGDNTLEHWTEGK